MCLLALISEELVDSRQKLQLRGPKKTKQQHADMAEVKLFLYQVVNEVFTPPTEGEAFERLDRGIIAADASFSPSMAAEEKRSGIRLMAGAADVLWLSYYLALDLPATLFSLNGLRAFKMDWQRVGCQSRS